MTLTQRTLHLWLDRYGTQQRAAYALDISPSYFSDLLVGRREPSAMILEKLGLETVIREKQETV